MSYRKYLSAAANHSIKNARVAAALAAEEDKFYDEFLNIVHGGICPDCGTELRRNSSIKGWWQCAQLGADNVRKDPTKPSCQWQGFER
jgi:hypothetical protein